MMDLDVQPRRYCSVQFNIDSLGFDRPRHISIPIGTESGLTKDRTPAYPELVEGPPRWFDGLTMSGKGDTLTMSGS
jgi:hypothetical protein